MCLSKSTNCFAEENIWLIQLQAPITTKRKCVTHFCLRSHLHP